MSVERRVAVVRIKGDVGLTRELRETFVRLRLYKKNHCVVISSNPSWVGMLKKVENCCTWGELDEETCRVLFQKRGKLPGNKMLTESYIQEKAKCSLDAFVKEFMACKKELADIPGMKAYFKLSPPRQGFEKKGVKVPYAQGGVLGYRKNGINDLIKRMV